MDRVEIEKKGRIAVVRFDRGARSNALSLSLMRELTAAARSFETDAETSAVILTGRADGFSMGFDLKDEETARLRAAPLAERRVALQTGGRMCRAWAGIQPLTIAAIEGWCVGGGAALAVSCDLRVMGRGATIYIPEIERGMNMSWGSVPRIVNLIGPARAKRALVLAERLEAETALAWGLADEVADDALAAAMALARRAAAMPPVPVRMIKQSIDAYANALGPAASHGDFDQFAVAQASDDHREAVEAFLEKRAPRFSGG